MNADETDIPVLRRALSFVEQAAERHDDTYVDAVLLAGNLNMQLGNSARGRMWFDRARS